jgi:hypothetical protein
MCLGVRDLRGTEVVLNAEQMAHSARGAGLLTQEDAGVEEKGSEIDTK